MFAKSAFLVRSLFVAAVFGSLVACTFDQPSSEEKGNTSSAISAEKKSHTDGGSESDSDSGVDEDAGYSDNDGGCRRCDQDGGASDNDAGWGDDDDNNADGGVDDSDGGAYGDDDDADGGTYDDRDAGF